MGPQAATIVERAADMELPEVEVELGKMEVELEKMEVEVGLFKILVILYSEFSDIAAEFLVCRIRGFLLE